MHAEGQRFDSVNLHRKLYQGKEERTRREERRRETEKRKEEAREKKE